MAGQPFRLGLTFAGAISAGAYSAGVIDFLVRALDTWEAEKAKPGTTVPQHRVEIRAMSGASAGAICAAVLSLTARRQWDWNRIGPATGTPLYKLWVESIGLSQLLAADDIERLDRLPLSLLNPRALDEARRATADRIAALPQRRGLPRWLAPDLVTYLTLRNLRGIGYGVPFAGGARYAMRRHADYAAFSYLNNQETSGAGMTHIPDDAQSPGWKHLFDAALGSSAVPIAFPPRTIAIEAPDKVYGARKFIRLVEPESSANRGRVRVPGRIVRIAECPLHLPRGRRRHAEQRAVRAGLRSAGRWALRTPARSGPRGDRRHPDG